MEYSFALDFASQSNFILQSKYCQQNKWKSADDFKTAGLCSIFTAHKKTPAQTGQGFLVLL